MKLSTERKIKFWISTLGKLALVVFLFIKAYDYFFKSDKVPPPAEANFSQKPVDRVAEDSSAFKRQSHNSIARQKPEEHKTVAKSEGEILLSKIILFKGKPLKNAYFTIEGCNSCKSTLTKEDGITQIKIPKKLHDDGLTHRFYVYQNDSLVYQKSMRFLNFQLNKY